MSEYLVTIHALSQLCHIFVTGFYIVHLDVHSSGASIGKGQKSLIDPRGNSDSLSRCCLGSRALSF